MAQPRPASFYAAILTSLASEGYTERVVIRTFAPMEAQEATEVLMLHHGRYPETCWVDASGVLIHGPIPGFGCTYE